MDFTRATCTGVQFYDEETRVTVRRRLGELYAAHKLRDETLGEDYPRVRDFYKGCHVLVTGASGFIGKVVVEKLLRSCPDIGYIYVIMRAKKGKDPQARVKAMLDVPLFDRLRQENPSAIDKVVAVNGDCAAAGLGLDPLDREMLVKQVSVIIHSAATVRFTELIRDAVRINLRCTADLVDMARQMKSLKVFVHISTAYCFTNHNPTEECVYPTDFNWRDVLKYAELPDADALDLLGHKFLGFQPNSYVFTKALAEHVIAEAAPDIPAIILRPTIVTCAMEDPLPGWMDNLNGFAMFWAGASMGVMRYAYSASSKYDVMPVDVVCKGIILASWVKGTNQPLAALNGAVQVINTSTGDTYPTTHLLMETVLQLHVDNNVLAYPRALRYPRFRSVRNKYVAQVLTFFYHILFGIAVDTILVVMGRKPMLLRVYRKIAYALESLQYFNAEHDFTFSSDNAWRLFHLVHPKDRKEFLHTFDFDPVAVTVDQLRGVAEYALKEHIGGPEEVKKHCRRAMRLWWAELFYYICLASFTVWLTVLWFR